MAFIRRSLSLCGLMKDQTEKVMALHGASMADFFPMADVQTRIDTAATLLLRSAPVCEKPRNRRKTEASAGCAGRCRRAAAGQRAARRAAAAE